MSHCRRSTSIARTTMDAKNPFLRLVWKQTATPVVFRQIDGKPLLIKHPDGLDSFYWIRNGRRSKPKWDSKYKCWQAPKAWFEDSVRRLLDDQGSVYVIQLVRRHQVCAPSCWTAKRIECECSCFGENHGLGSPGGRWYVLDDTCAVHWGPNEYSCQLLSPNDE